MSMPLSVCDFLAVAEHDCCGCTWKRRRNSSLWNMLVLVWFVSRYHLDDHFRALREVKF